jgi:hypothetical protein
MLTVCNYAILTGCNYALLTGCNYAILTGCNYAMLTICFVQGTGDAFTARYKPSLNVIGLNSRTDLIWAVMHCVVVSPNRRFGTSYQSIFKDQKIKNPRILLDPWILDT